MYRKQINNKYELRNLFKRHVSKEEYRQYTHFVWVKQLKSNIPGTKSIYIMYDGGVAIATNAICINEFCSEHGLGRIRPLTEKSVETKIRVNGTDKIDNRTKEWSIWKPTRNPKNCVIAGSGFEIRELVWDLYVNQQMSAGEIAHHLNCTPPNIYYHLKRKQKELDIIA